MAKDTHVIAPTRFVEAGGIRYAHRRFGAGTGTPLVFLQHFRGGLDNWDPLVTDGLAQERPVVLFNNAGVASSSGETPNTIDAMGDHVAAFVNVLGLPQVDVLGLLHRRLRCAEFRASPPPSREAPRARGDRPA
jgi:pimeloyl-ACP methyl ester carboxylesterase